MQHLDICMWIFCARCGYLFKDILVRFGEHGYLHAINHSSAASHRSIARARQNSCHLRQGVHYRLVLPVGPPNSGQFRATGSAGHYLRSLSWAGLTRALTLAAGKSRVLVPGHQAVTRPPDRQATGPGLVPVADHYTVCSHCHCPDALKH